jgi:hypothetical protein
MSNYFDNKDLFIGPKTTQYGGHMVMTNVAKERKKKFINIDTRFKDEYTSGICNGSELISITLPERINEVKKMKVRCAEIPVCGSLLHNYNISNNLGNNYFKVNDAIITIPDGQYTTTSLATAITAALASSSNVIVSSCSAEISNTTSKFLFKNSYDNGNYQGESVTFQFAVDKYGNFDRNLKSKLGYLLGFRDNQFVLSAASFDNNNTIIPSTLTASEQINFNIYTYIPRYIYLVIDEFNQGNPHSFIAPLNKSFINKNIIARIVLNYNMFPDNSILTANLTNGLLVSDTREFSGKVNLQKLGVQLLDEYGNQVDLGGLDFSFCIEIEHE